MAVPKAKKPKKPVDKEYKERSLMTIKLTNYLNLAVMVRSLYTVYGWRKTRLAKFVECYCLLMEEVVDKRSGVEQFIKDTTKVTGIDVRKFLDEVYK